MWNDVDVVVWNTVVVFFILFSNFWELYVFHLYRLVIFYLLKWDVTSKQLMPLTYKTTYIFVAGNIWDIVLIIHHVLPLSCSNKMNCFTKSNFFNVLKYNVEFWHQSRDKIKKQGLNNLKKDDQWLCCGLRT